ncbi:MAG: hypothetical protein NUW37_06670 [Planctomycetes bacterium]|nr:hypothetical protein [Planctomycetota bacterium]
MALLPFAAVLTFGCGGEPIGSDQAPVESEAAAVDNGASATSGVTPGGAAAVQTPSTWGQQPGGSSAAPAPAQGPVTGGRVEPVNIPTPEARGVHPDVDDARSNMNQYRNLLEEASRDLAEQRRRDEQLISFYLQDAQRKHMEGDTLSALANLDRILERNPLHPEAMRLKEEILANIGDRERTTGRLEDDLRAQYAVVVEKARIEALAQYDEGNTAYREQRYSDAITHYERCIEIIDFAPADLDLHNIRITASSGIDDATAQRISVQREEDRRAREIAARIAALQRERERTERKNRIVELLLSAQENYSARRWDRCRANIAEVLRLDPTNEVARQMEADLKWDGLVHSADQHIRNRIESYRRLLEDWSETLVPYMPRDGVEYPDTTYWERVNQRQFNRAGEEAVAEDPRVVRIKNRLESLPIEVRFHNMRFIEAIDFFKSYAGINIVVDKDVSVIDEEISTFDASGLSVGDALDLLLKIYGLDREFREGVLYITEEGQTSTEAILRLHDIRDIVRPVPDFPGAEIQLPQAGGAGAAGGFSPTFQEAPEVEPEIDITQIMDLIQNSIETDSWGNDPFSIRETPDNQLLVFHNPDVQARVESLLADLRANSGLMVEVETRFLSVEDHFLDFFGVDFRGLGGVKGTNAPMEDVVFGPEDFSGGTFDNSAGGTPTSLAPSSGIFFNDSSDGDIRARTEHIVDGTIGDVLQPVGGGTLQFIFIDDTELNMIVRAVQKQRNAMVMTAPRLVAFNTQRANLTIIDQVAYIRDFDVQIAQAASLADPIVATVQDGLVLDITPTISNDRRFITLELRPTVAELLRPIPTFTTNLGAGALATTPVTIQIPELVLKKAETTVKVPDGGSVLIGGLKRAHDVTQEQSIPWLADLPFIGWLFRSSSHSVERESLIILVTARVIDLNELEMMQH